MSEDYAPPDDYCLDCTQPLDKCECPSAAAELLKLVKTGDYLQHTEFPPLTYVVAGLIVEGLTVLVGPPKSGKSWWVLAMLLAVSSGGRAFGRLQVEQRPTLYLALEDSERRLKDRSRLLLGPDPIPAGFTFVTRVEPYQLHALMSAWADRNPAGLIVLDTLGKATPPARQGESAYARDYRIAGSLKAVADLHPGLSVVVNHHDRKAEAADFVDSVSGTHGLAGAADTILALKRPRGEATAVLHVTGRDVDEAEYAMTLQDGYRWALDGTGLIEAARNAAAVRAQAGLGDDAGRIVGYVVGSGREVGAAEIALALKLDRAKVDKYLARQSEAGRIIRTRRGRYAGTTTPLSEVGEVSEVEADTPAASDTSDTSDRGTPATPTPENGIPGTEGTPTPDGSPPCPDCDQPLDGPAGALCGARHLHRGGDQ